MYPLAHCILLLFPSLELFSLVAISHLLPPLDSLLFWPFWSIVRPPRRPFPSREHIRMQCRLLPFHAVCVRSLWMRRNRHSGTASRAEVPPVGPVYSPFIPLSSPVSLFHPLFTPHAHHTCVFFPVCATVHFSSLFCSLLLCSGAIMKECVSAVICAAIQLPWMCASRTPCMHMSPSPYSHIRHARTPQSFFLRRERTRSQTQAYSINAPTALIVLPWTLPHSPPGLPTRMRRSKPHLPTTPTSMRIFPVLLLSQLCSSPPLSLPFAPLSSAPSSSLLQSCGGVL